jgi:predicted Zn-dependent protease
MRDYFYHLADETEAQLKPDEDFTCHLLGEDSDFVRFNRNRVRQAGHVRQIEINLDLIEGARHAATQFNVTGEIGCDVALLKDQIQVLRSQRAHLPDDPYLLYATEPHSSENRREGQLPEAGDAVRDIVTAADGLNLVGILASGLQYQGFASSLGSRNWFGIESFNFDWSCYLDTDKAVKSGYAGFVWKPSELHARIEHARAQLAMLSKPPETLSPGHYRAYLAPAALHEIFDTVGNGGFSLKQRRTMQSPLLKLAQQERLLAPSINITENHAQGLAPPFTPGGFIKPPQVNLIRHGQCADILAGARSAREYGVPVNAASEGPESLDMAGGELTITDVLKRLDDGLYINNLWYCNFSNRADCRLTGTTRYACFQVKRGEIKAPITVMRFDDSLFRMLGDCLTSLTRERELRFDAETYHRRSIRSVHLPGALIDGFNLTL